ncbi:MAG: hypothetical protein Q8N23_30665 [Archangium sp.]|nr:hypothetical protein [Archangium sp.]MDP3575791.1 hypothetical protein [Archangium sp.]
MVFRPACLVVFALASCRSPQPEAARVATLTVDAGQPVVMTPPVLDGERLGFPGTGMAVLFSLSAAEYELDAIELPKGSTIEAGGKTVSIDGTEKNLVRLLLPLDLAPLATKPIAVIEGGEDEKWGPDIAVTITIPGREVVSVVTPRHELSTWFSVSFMVDDSKGLRFGASDTAPHAAGRRTVVYPAGATKYFGPGKQLRDIDWVVIQDTLAEPEDPVSCTYAGFNGARFQVLLEREVKALSIFDRRTGKRLSGKRFVSPADCAETATGKKHASGYVEANSTGSQHTSVDEAVVTAWIAAQRLK